MDVIRNLCLILVIQVITAVTLPMSLAGPRDSSKENPNISCDLLSSLTDEQINGLAAAEEASLEKDRNQWKRLGNPWIMNHAHIAESLARSIKTQILEKSADTWISWENCSRTGIECRSFANQRLLQNLAGEALANSKVSNGKFKVKATADSLVFTLSESPSNVPLGNNSVEVSTDSPREIRFQRDAHNEVFLVVCSPTLSRRTVSDGLKQSRVCVWRSLQSNASIGLPIWGRSESVDAAFEADPTGLVNDYPHRKQDGLDNKTDKLKEARSKLLGICNQEKQNLHEGNARDNSASARRTEKNVSKEYLAQSEDEPISSKDRSLSRPAGRHHSATAAKTQ